MDKELILSINGFNEALEKWGADDLELGYRLYQKGISFEYSFKAGGTHLYHGSSMDANGYYENLTKFFLQYKHPAIELLFVEYLLSPRESFFAYKYCEQCTNIEIDEKTIENFEKPILFNNIKVKGYDSTFGFGIYLDDITKKYKTYIINGNLALLGTVPRFSFS